MANTLIQSLRKADFEAVIQQYTMTDWFYPTLFPLKQVNSLNFGVLMGIDGAKVAADVVSFNSKSVEKKRKAIRKLHGELPKIAIKAPEMKEQDFYDVMQLQNEGATIENSQALRDFVFNDAKFCFDGVQARLELLALRALSTGRIVLDSTSNKGGIVTENVVSFGIPENQKKGTAKSWLTHATSTPIDDVRAIVKDARTKGIKLAYMYMSQSTFDHFAASEQVIKQAASWVGQAITGNSLIPSLANVNTFLLAQGLPTISIIDTSINVEDKDGSQTVVFPFADEVVSFSPTTNVGQTLYLRRYAEEMIDSGAMISRNGLALIKKEAELSPPKEITEGIAIAFPVLTSAPSIYLLDVKNANFVEK